ncbi:MAG: DUF4349 domain-containing protein, partial [Bacteroidia bacterium]
MKNLCLSIAVCFLFSCNNRSAESQSQDVSNEDKPLEAAAPAVAEAEAPVAGLAAVEDATDDGAFKSESGKETEFSFTTTVANDAAAGSTPEPESKTKDDLTATSLKLIKNGYLTLEVENYKESRKKIKDLVLKNGGYLGNETESNETYRISNELTIRIPVKAFDILMEGLISEGIKTDSKRIEVKDVGEEYADLTARIEAKKAVEKRYLEILNKANKITDILEVEEKLRVIREETEAAQGRVKYLESQVSFSTIHLSFYKTLDTHYTPPSGPGFFSRIWKGLVKG